jgi:polysaccharide export outer membrane protein
MTNVLSFFCPRAIASRWGLLAVSLLCSAVSAKAEYRLNAGDVIEVAVAGVPELRQRVTVQLDGSISLPLLGNLMLAGSTSSEARAKIQSALATKVFRQRTTDGRERPLVIEFDEVAATVVEYRPIYVSGNVSRPGEQTYRPHMTVRQAIASSGGYDVLRLRTNTTLREAIDLQADHASLWASFAKEQAHIWRIKSELGDEIAFDANFFKESPLSQATISDILKVEAEHLKTRQADYEREKDYLRRAISQAEQHTSVLTNQQQKEEEGTQADAQELQRVSDLFAKGALAMPRVTEARRALLLSSTRQLQTNAQLMHVTRQRGELARQLEKLDDQRRITLLKDLQDAGGRLSGIRAKLQAIGELIQYTSRPQTAGESRKKPEITVFRKGENGGTRFAADGDTELQPGDVVEVALRAEHAEAIGQ